MNLFYQKATVKLITTNLLLLVLITLTNCGVKPRTNQPSQFTPSPLSVLLGAGDVLDIRFYNTPELNETQTVRPDGKISLQLVGEAEVQGKTTSQLQDELIKLYSSQLKNPEITVIVRSLYSHRVYVSGEVNTPRFVEAPRRMSVLEAIMEAGGFDMTTANVNNVVVIRYKENQRYGYKLNLKPALKGKEDQPFFLEPYDIVYVPRTKITAVNQWIDQYIDGLIPNTVLSLIPLRIQYLYYKMFRESIRDSDAVSDTTNVSN